MFGLILIALGVLFLLKNLGVISGEVWGIFWPILIIIIGLEIFISSITKRRWFRNFFSCERDFWDENLNEKREGKD
ncbi:MAG: hypothetical protein H5U37_01305 [Caldisericia bacterium]|nr:hypothetical protein [Caldisericia bacterium]